MRRMIITAVATVSLAAPSAALAHAGGGHHRHHSRHHRHARVLAFHAQAPASSASPTSSSGAPASSSDSAGTIASFTNGVLAITLSDGTTVSGKVTERTEIECPAPSASAADFSRSDGGGDNGDDNGNDETGGPGPADGEHGEQAAGEDDGNDGGAGGEAGHCTTAALVIGASVKEAFLSVGNEGPSWLKVEL